MTKKEKYRMEELKEIAFQEFLKYSEYDTLDYLNDKEAKEYSKLVNKFLKKF